MNDEDLLLLFFECLQLLNAKQIRNQDTGELQQDPMYSIAKDFFHTAAEICYLGKLNTVY